MSSTAFTSASPLVRYEVLKDHIAVATLDRPAARNAINGEIADALDGIVAHTNGNDSIRAVVLASADARVFCAGADLAEIAAGNADKLGTPDGGFAGLTQAARNKPWIAAVEGAALAGGCELVLACDLIVASSAARFGLPEVCRGLYAGAGGPYRLAKVLPRNIALELIATGRPIDGARAHQLGMVNVLAGAADTFDRAIELAALIAANAPLAVRESLDIAKRAGLMSEAEFWTESRAVADRVFSSADAQEGPRAFLEKREPRWIGR